MRASGLTVLMIIGICLFLALPSIRADTPIMEKTDPDDDVFMITDPLADPDEVSQDVEILSASIDWSGDTVVCEFIVKGEAVNISSDDSVNVYYFNIDLTTANDEEEIWFLYTDTGLSGGSLETGIITLWEDDFSSVDGTFTFEFDRSHFGEHQDVLDIEVRAQNTNGWLDEIRWGEGLPADDDDTTDDDETDADSSDDDTSDDDDDDDDDSPGFSFLLALGSVFIVLAVLAQGRRIGR
ncbi:MAG: hypothetical protein ACMUHY_00960 [Thermoplasmatota archaeon]